ncbi:hypothetical protein KAU32_07185 [bacterium]|nr:hypothetical protein [bacterium]
MKRITIILGLCIGIFALCSCKTQNRGLEIYVLNKKAEIVQQNVIAEIELPEIPFISQDNIEKYYWKEHVMLLNEGASEKIAKIKANMDDYHETIFVLTIDRVPIYWGRFWSIKDSRYVDFPIIPLEAVKKERIYIHFYDMNSEDPRENAKIYTFLKREGLLL